MKKHPPSVPWSKTRNKFLRDKEAAFLYLQEVFSDDDDELFKRALKYVIQAQKGSMAALARKIRLSPNRIYRALSPKGHLDIVLTAKILKALGLHLLIQPQEQKELKKAA